VATEAADIWHWRTSSSTATGVGLSFSTSRSRPSSSPIAPLAGGGAAPAAGDGGRRPASEPLETLSDDELERKFIQARINVAVALKEKGKKSQAIETLEDVIKTYPKHVETKVAKKLLEELRK